MALEGGISLDQQFAELSQFQVVGDLVLPDGCV